MTPANLLQKSKQELRGVSAQPYQESLWILAEVLQCPAPAIYLEKENIDKSREKLFWDKVYQRKQGRPLEYILNEKFFFDKKFYVEEGVFIPRRETESLIRWVLKNIRDTKFKALDFGAGTGTLCLPLLSFFPHSQFIAMEISHKSILCLKKNSQAFRVGDRLKILKKDVSHLTKKDLCWLDLKNPSFREKKNHKNSLRVPISTTSREQKSHKNSLRVPIMAATNSREKKSHKNSLPSLIVANPPYIDPKDLSLSRTAYLFDPPLALFSDKAGMGHIVSWFKKAMELLGPKGIYIFELGWNQEERVREFLSRQTKLNSYKIYKDEGGNPRLAVCVKK